MHLWHQCNCESGDITATEAMAKEPMSLWHWHHCISSIALKNMIKWGRLLGLALDHNKLRGLIHALLASDATSPKSMLNAMEATSAAATTESFLASLGSLLLNQ